MNIVKLAARSVLLLLSLNICIRSISDDDKATEQDRLWRQLEVLRDETLSLRSDLNSKTCARVSVDCFDWCRRTRCPHPRGQRRWRRKQRRKFERWRTEMTRKYKHCPTGFYSYHKNCYMFSYLNQTWEEARNTCLLMGSHLLQIKTGKDKNKELNFVSRFINRRFGNFSHDFYIGLVFGYEDENGLIGPASMKLGKDFPFLEKRWERKDAERPDVKDWECSDTIQPNLDSSNYCAVLKSGCIAWDHCNQRRPFICEVKD